MIKIRLSALDFECEIEVKKNAEDYILLVIMSKSDYYKNSGNAWHGQIKDEGEITAIEVLLESCYKYPSVTKWVTINDGMTAYLDCQVNGVEIKFQIKDFRENNKEAELMKRIFVLSNNLIKDPVWEAYTKMLASELFHKP